MSSRSLRLARGSVAASFATFVALLAHVTGGGSVPAPVGIVAPLILSIAVCTFISGRRLSLVRLTASVSLAQALFHLLFTLGTGQGHGSADRIGHLHAAPVIASAGMSPTSERLMDTGTMWLSHAIAAVVTIGLLFFAERILEGLSRTGRRVADWVGRIVRSLTAQVLPVAAPPTRARSVVSRPRQSHRRVGVSRRGPPLFA